MDPEPVIGDALSDPSIGSPFKAITQANVREAVREFDPSVHTGFLLEEPLRSSDYQMLAAVPGCTSVSVGRESNTPTEALKLFRHVTRLNLCAREPFDLGEFDQLSQLRVYGHQGLMLPHESNQLQKIEIYGASEMAPDLSFLAPYTRLRDVWVREAKTVSLSGIERLQALEILWLFYLPQLVSIKGVEATPVRDLTIADCPKIGDLDCLGQARHLEAIRGGRIGKLSSIGFIASIPSLHTFIAMDTDIADGDLRPLERLHEVNFTSKRHFSHKMKGSKMVRRDG